MRKFDTQVQHLKYKVLREVARHAFAGDLLSAVSDIPKTIVPGKDPSMRCCVYKERAILTERVKLAMGGNKSNRNVIEVIDIACDECPVGGYEVSQACRGCIAHRCQDVCPRDAISFDQDQKAYIDKSKCVECGKCAQVCPFSAIANIKRPCEKACHIGAISMSDDKTASINNDKCTACGACVYQCPFGAIMDKSYILDVIELLQDAKASNQRVYAVVAPSISSQFTYARLGQVISGIKKLGFFHVVEAALGADMTAWQESRELAEKGFLTSSCCPSFVSYVRSEFPQMADSISHNLSPMAEIARYIKQTSDNARVVFIGPCTAKKMELQLPDVSPWVDSVITFEELQSLFDGADINICDLQDDVLDNASFYGRIFARSGGLSDAVKQAAEEQQLDFDIKPVVCDGIDACRVALLKASKGRADGNFIEGMACSGGCIGGAGCLTHGPKDKSQVDKYGMEAYEKTIADAVSVLGN